MSFEAFWKAYPRRVAKLAAKRAYEKAIKNATHQEIMEGVERYVAYTKNTEQRFIAHPATWLNSGRWEDDLTDARALANLSVGSVFASLASKMESNSVLVRCIQGDEGIREAFPLLSFAFEQPE
jgi:hypothetical protein